MLYKITGEQPFQVLSSSFSISPSESGYDLYLSADGINYSPFITVASGVTKQMVDMNEGNYYRLMGNTSTVTVNWMKECGGGGGGAAAGVSSLDGQTGALTTKTINGNAILGSGDIVISGSGSSVSYSQTLSAGTEIGQITIDGSATTIYAPSGESEGRIVIDLDALSQAEKAALFEEISGLTSDGQAVNDKYVFIKSFTSQHVGNQTPYAVEYTKYESSKMWFLGFNWGGQSGEIWVLKYSLQADGTDEASMAPNYSFNNLDKLKIFRNRDWVKYDFTTSTFSTSSAGDTIFTGDTCSGAWVTDFNTNTFTNAGVPEFKFKVTDETYNDRLFTNPAVSYETLASPVTLEDAHGTQRSFPYIWFLDYGYCVVSMYVDLEQQRYARLSIERRKKTVAISQADYDALVLAGTVDANTLYIII